MIFWLTPKHGEIIISGLLSDAERIGARESHGGRVCFLTFPLMPDLYELSIFGVNETENKIT